MCAGETLRIERVSPFIIILKPPEKLVIEMRAFGRYVYIEWSRKGFTAASKGILVTPPSSYVNFGEIYHNANTNGEDFGVYNVRLVPFRGQRIVDTPVIVTEPGKSYSGLPLIWPPLDLSSVRIREGWPLFGGLN